MTFRQVSIFFSVNSTVSQVSPDSDSVLLNPHTPPLHHYSLINPISNSSNRKPNLPFCSMLCSLCITVNFTSALLPTAVHQQGRNGAGNKTTSCKSKQVLAAVVPPGQGIKAAHCASSRAFNDAPRMPCRHAPTVTLSPLTAPCGGRTERGSRRRGEPAKASK